MKMRRMIGPLALAMVGVLTVSAAEGGKVPGGGQFFDNVKVPMRDGVNLAADVYVPSNRPAAKIGCLLTFSPYKATAPAKPSMADRAEEWGVATVSADCRGLCHSEGTFEPWDPKLVDDADDLLSWIAAQPWSNGRVVMVGGSYPGNTQLAAMRSGNPALVACAPSVITFDPYPINFQNGILIPQFFKGWHVGLAGSNSWDRLAAHPARDDWWQARADLRNLKKSKARAFYQAGWFDMLGIDTFNTLKEMPEGSVLRIGPWSHGVDTFDNPEINYKELGGLVTEDAEIEFLRSALDGRESESKRWPGKILMYVMGRNEWRYEKTWPLEGMVERAFDFTAGETRSFAHDPKNPVPMKGGRIIHAGGQYDQREIEKRPDVLSYTGEVLAEDLEVIGDVAAELKLSSTAACSDVTVKLVDVYPDGRAMNVLEGIKRISFKPGEPKTVRFKLDITAYAFLKGHRIRVDVAGSCAPHFEVNPVPAKVTVYAGSKLLLPCAKPAGSDEPTVVSQDELWNGRRTVYRFRGREAWVIEPKTPAEGRPWTWTVQWWNAYVPRTAVPDMIAAGAHHVVLDMFDTRARTDADLATMAAWQAFVVKKYGLCPKARLIGMSWGGFFSTRYAAKYPQNVGWIYYDCPLLNFDKFASDNPGRIGSWANDLPKDGKWSDDPRMPVNLAGTIAKAGIKTMIAYGGQDQTVTPSLNSELFITRLKAAGAKPIVKYRYAYGHHPHGMEIGERTIPDFFEIK